MVASGFKAGSTRGLPGFHKDFGAFSGLGLGSRLQGCVLVDPWLALGWCY